MKLIIEAEPKEIADLVLAVQGQQNTKIKALAVLGLAEIAVMLSAVGYLLEK